MVSSAKTKCTWQHEFATLFQFSSQITFVDLLSAHMGTWLHLHKRRNDTSISEEFVKLIGWSTGRAQGQTSRHLHEFIAELRNSRVQASKLGPAKSEMILQASLSQIARSESPWSAPGSWKTSKGLYTKSLASPFRTLSRTLHMAQEHKQWHSLTHFFNVNVPSPSFFGEDALSITCCQWSWASNLRRQTEQFPVEA